MRYKVKNEQFILGEVILEDSMARLEMNMKKKIGIPTAVGLWCLSKVLKEAPFIASLLMLMAIVTFFYTVIEEYMAARRSIRILLGILMTCLLVLCIGLMLPYEIGVFEGQWPLVLLVVMLISGASAFFIPIKDDLLLYFRMQRSKAEDKRDE